MTETLDIRTSARTSISMSGLRVPFEGEIPEAGASCRVAVALHAFDQRIEIEAAGRIIKSDRGSLAVEFTALDVDSYDHLRKLILNNAKDPEKAEQELLAHRGIKRIS